ncbi:hypothetical protein ACFYVR_21800 [Rhodococcus sp. NPDC003318]|uniref:hypothetical protein n=1 Tax=Rhodococcus sp. NPDC003318 TaxID=3364503 RepID=UPI0036C19061
MVLALYAVALASMKALGLVVLVAGISYLLYRLVRHIPKERYFASEEFPAHTAKISSVVAEHNDIARDAAEFTAITDSRSEPARREHRDRTGGSVTGYAIEWDGTTVTLPPAGDLNPDGVSWAWITDDDGEGIYDRRLVDFADAAFAASGKRVGSISVPFVLIPRPDNPYDSDAVSIALPKSMGGDEEDRCLGYLYRNTIEYWGIASGRRKDLVARLAALSAGGEVHFTATMSRDTDPADIERYRCSDDEEGWDIDYRLPEFRLDLPGARIMGAAIRAFLSEHETNESATLAAQGRDRAIRAQLAKPLTPKARWLQDLRTELVERLAGEVVTHSNSNRHGALEVLRQRNFATKVVDENGGCIGVVLTRPDLVVVGNEFDRPAVIEALDREGFDPPFDPTPGWLNASLHRDSDGWIHVVWIGRIAGMNVEPILASFDVHDKELHLFAVELETPIQGLLRRAGHVSEKVVLRPHPRDPGQFFGQDLIARLESPQAARMLRPEARALIPAEWAEHIESGWRAKQDIQSRNTQISQTILFARPVDQFPPDDPQLPPGLFDQRPADDPNPDAPPCRLCGEALNPYAEPLPYCLDCVGDASTGLFADRGFDEPWAPAVLWSLKQLAALEFGGAPARDQLRAMPTDGPHADLLMLCRMLTARHGKAVPGGQRKVYSWADWLGQAGLLAGGVRTSRGVTVMAKDGHICRSLLERQIDDFFFDHGVPHQPEPHYPFDPEINPNGYRADWKLADGTFVEALGFTTNTAYMDKAQRKIALAAKHQIPIVTVTVSDLPNLPTIFAKWLPQKDDQPRGAALPPRPAITIRRTKPTPGAKANGQNPTNTKLRADRLERCRRAVELQSGGATRSQISEHLGINPDGVASLLRDGKFFANPTSDSDRLMLAQSAASARKRRLTRAEFQDEEQLSTAKAKECWRDADVLFGTSVTD